MEVVRFELPDGKAIAAGVDVWIGALLAELTPEQGRRIFARVEAIKAECKRIAAARQLVVSPLEARDFLNGSGMGF